MTFTSSLALLLLLLIPLFAWMGWPPPGPSRRREMFSLALRLLLVLCLVFALAGLSLLRSGNNLAVVFLIDVSDSMSRQAISAEMDYVRAAIRAMGPDDQSAVVLFGADALVERSMSAVRELDAVASVPITNQTDLAGAMRLGMALFPSGAARRLVILSDGEQTSGDALAAARFAAASGIQIVSVPFLKEAGSETLVSNVDAPSRLRPGEKFDLGVSIQAAEAGEATVRILSGGQTIYEQPHTLRRGSQTFSLPLTAGEEPGFVNYHVQVDPHQDGFYQNNRLDAFSQVEGNPRVLVVAPAAGEVQPDGRPRPDETAALLGALRAADFDIEVATPALMPSTLPGLAQYNAVVLVNVPATAFGLRQMENLQIYVRDLGGGLVAVGGPTSFGVGGYYETPLEATLPVDMQIKDEKRRPTLGMVFIIDHSGSMEESSGGVTKLELAKEAAARSVELLFPTDRVGVIAFDDSATWVVPMTELSNPGAVTSAIGGIQSGGGTDILAGVQAMSEVLPGDPAKAKHVILLTDGMADETGIIELVTQLNTQNAITLSTVAVGRDAAPFLKDLAVAGQGRYHFTADASSIPSIFTQETTLAARSYIVEESFFPVLVNPSPILAGIDSIPQLHGYVGASAKDLAQVILKSGKDDPVLSSWQYGLGRAVAFTSDATGRWGRDWVAWPGFASFWAQAVRYTLGDSSKTALDMDIRLDEGKQAHLTLDARSRSGGFLNGYNVMASVVAPGGETQSVTLRQVAPGRYEGFFDPTEQGVYLLRFSGEPADGSAGQSFAQTEGWTLSYSPEYRRIESDPDLLLRLAALTGGGAASANPADAFAHTLTATGASTPLWPWLLLLAALLLPLDVASRRLTLTRHDWARFGQTLIARLRPGKRETAAPAQTAQMAALFQAKDRAREGSKPAPDEKNLPAQPAVIAPLPASDENPPEAPAPSQEPASTTEALLARKRNLRDKR